MYKISSLVIILFITLLISGCFSLKNENDKIITTQYGKILPEQLEETKAPKEAKVFEKRTEYIPPIIPHTTKKMEISKNKTTCLECHTSHFKENILISSYKNCISCHR
jgi:nitrate reductase cytochrome c-type subunit